MDGNPPNFWDLDSDSYENLQKKNNLGICTRKIGVISQLEAEKITFPPKPDGHTDRQTDGHLLL